MASSYHSDQYQSVLKKKAYLILASETLMMTEPSLFHECDKKDGSSGKPKVQPSTLMAKGEYCQTGDIRIEQMSNNFRNFTKFAR